AWPKIWSGCLSIAPSSSIAPVATGHPLPQACCEAADSTPSVKLPAALRRGKRRDCQFAIPNLNISKSHPRSVLLKGVLPGEVAQHVRVNIEANVGHVVDVLRGHQPDDFAGLALGIIAAHTRKRVRAHAFCFCEFGYIVQRRALCIGK